MTKLNIQSIFHSIDGEANGFQGAGQLCTFIRLKGCQLRCQYCDSKYSQEFEPSNWMTIEEVVEQIKFPKITITGGEPLIQQEAVNDLCSNLIYRCEKEHLISIETNGTIIPTFSSNSIRYVMDWKLPSSGMEHKMNLKAFSKLNYADIIKFVISDWNDYSRTLAVINQYPHWKAQIVFSPAVTIIHPTLESQVFENKNSYVDMTWPRQLLERMIHDEIPAQFSLQIHKVIWPGATEER